DNPDEVWASLLPLASPTSLISAAASRNFSATCSLLIDQKADLAHVDVQRGRRWGLVDLAARAANLDGDWRLVTQLLSRGCQAESPEAVLHLPLRRGDVALGRHLLDLGINVNAETLVRVLCDICAHGVTKSAALLIDTLQVPVNSTSERGETCTDFALAWHSWSTAEWLVTERGGAPANPSTALRVLLDSRGRDAEAERLFARLRALGAFEERDLLMAAACRGDLVLLGEVLAACAEALGDVSCTPPLVDVALCHGHLEAALWLLRRGAVVQDIEQARADALMYSRTKPGLAAKVLASLLPEKALGHFGGESAEHSDEELTPNATTAGDTFSGLRPEVVGGSRSHSSLGHLV
ncbi:unnamed protein product, partial [Polarella glacialis]